MNTNAEIQETLKAAKALVAAGWFQGNLASSGQAVTSPLDPESKYFCALGAMERACFRRAATLGKVQMAFVDANPETKGCVSIWNDAYERTKEEVLTGFDKAIASLGA